MRHQHWTPEHGAGSTHLLPVYKLRLLRSEYRLHPLLMCFLLHVDVQRMDILGNATAVFCRLHIIWSHIIWTSDSGVSVALHLYYSFISFQSNSCFGQMKTMCGNKTGQRVEGLVSKQAESSFCSFRNSCTCATA